MVRAFAIFAVFVLFAFAQAATRASVLDPRVDSIVKTSGAALHVAAMRNIHILHLTITAVRPGTSGTVESWIEVGGLRNAERYAVGADLGGTGWDGKDDWTVGQTGVVSVDGGDASRYQTIASAYIHGYDLWTLHFGGASVAYAGTNVDHKRTYDVLRITAPGSKLPVSLWIDRTTHLAGRLVEVVGPTTYVENLSDYRPIHGLMVAFRENEYAVGGGVTNELVRRVAVNPRDGDTRLAEPRSNVHDFSIVDGAPKTVVPISLSENRVYLQVLLDGKGPYNFILDTNGQNVLDPAIARLLGAAKGADVVTVRSMRIGGAILANQPFYVGPVREQSMATAGKPADGIIGFDMFWRFVTTLDYAGRRATFSMPGSYFPPADAKVIPIVLNSQQPQFACVIDTVPAECTVNTGSAGSVSLFAPFVRDNSSIVPSKLTANGVTGFDGGGPTMAKLGRLNHLSFGGFQLDDVVAAFTTQPLGTFGAPFVGGDLGGNIWKRFTITLDYRKNTMTLLPKTNLHDSDEADRSGLYLIRRRGACVVADVRPRTSAARAGLVKGDTIASIDGKPIASLTLESIRDMFREAPGTVMGLTIRGANGKTRTLKLTLAEIV